MFDRNVIIGEWISELTSGKYHQSFDEMYDPSNNAYTACGLLVQMFINADPEKNWKWCRNEKLQSVSGLNSLAKFKNCVIVEQYFAFDAPPVIVCQWANLTVDEVNKILNFEFDGSLEGRTFEEVAMYIKKLRNM